MTMCTYFGTLKLIIMINLWTSICLQDAQAIRNRFEVVQRCPFNESEWKVRAAHTTCNGSESYHCLLTEGGVSLREQCTDASLFTSGFCPIFTNEGYLQWSACKDTACPTSSYRSDEVYQYQICYQKTDNPIEPIEKNTEKGSNDSSSVTGVTIIIIVAISLAIVLVSVFVFYRRNQCRFICDLRTHFQPRNDTNNLKDVERGEPPEQSQPLMQQDTDVELPEKKIEKLKELLKYLVQILKQELSVNNLKEKVVIHSKSVNEHFSEQLTKDLQSLKDINDYSQLDISLVFALLRNFCEDIKPPSRGWDYEPPDDDTHVGADIERIRSMWNKYCDNDSQFKHLEDVYKRMKQKYGTVAVMGGDYGIMKSSSKDEENTEGSELMKEKINSIKLNPDCTVEKGIVITENVTTALRLLQLRNVVILKGVIGCGKTHALKAIQNHFKGKHWETEWGESEILQEEISTKGPTILLCDNLFGQFGSCVFSQTDVEKNEKTLGAIEGAGDNIKVVIGIHTHVYDEVNKSLKLNFINKKNITVDMDKLSEAESLLIFKEQLKQGHCSKLDPNCWFKSVGFQSVLDRLSKNQGQIGNPFLSLMYCNQHELFSDEAFSVNPVQTMVQYIEKMKHDSFVTYDCLVYLMCVQQHNIEEEPENWVGVISLDITKHNLIQLSKTSGLFRVENKIATLAHELLTTVLFKCAAEKKEILLPVLQLCKIDVFLQLLRPTDSTHRDFYFEYTFNDCSEFSKRIGKMCAYRLSQKYKNHEIAHPLMTVEIVKNRYVAYLKREPKLLFHRGSKVNSSFLYRSSPN
nr:uncharacterized protein LOC105324417 [Crassostrea gigas]XP_034338181.1 uncharacterized protein LOC105324417 [Crassostrea gigas]